MSDEIVNSPETSPDPEGDRKNQDRPDLGGLPPEIVDKLPKEMVQSIEFFSAGGMTNPVMKQIKPEHIDKLLENVDKADQRQADAHARVVSDKAVGRKHAWVGLVVVLLIVALAWGMMPEGRTESFKDVLINVIMLGAGCLAGYGYAKSQN